MSSPNHSIFDIEDAFSSMNILNYTSALAGSSSFNSSENSTDNIIPPVFSSFYNNPCWKKGLGSGYHQKDRKPRQNDKTEHGMEKTVQNQGQSPKMPKSESILKNQQSNRSRN
ncbi:hypothetical protein Tco_0733748 [Tanacetum coccineum]